MASRRKTHCINGHEIDVVGRTSSGHCRPCQRNYKRKHARKTYGFAAPTAETKKGACEICLREVECLHLDHNHETGATRGWLCNACNPGLGYFKDNPELLERAAQYLRSK